MRYNGSLTREQFMFREMRIVTRMLRAGLSREEILARTVAENLFQYPTEREIGSKCRACLARLECISDMPAVEAALAEGILSEARQAVLISMMCQNRLVREFMLNVIAEKYRALDLTLTRKDMNLFFQSLAERDDAVAGWSESTVARIKSVLRNCLCEAEYLSDSKSEILLPVMIPEEFVDDLKLAGHREFLPAFNVLD